MVLNTDNVFEQTVESAADEYFIQEAEQALRPRIVVKSANQSRTNSTVLTNDTELLMSLSAQCTYEFELFLGFSTAGSGDPGIQFTFTVPTGCIGYYYITNDDSIEVDTSLSLGTFLPIPFGTSSDWISENKNAECGLVIRGIVKVANTAGNLQFKFAQFITDADATVVYASSTLKVTRQ